MQDKINSFNAAFVDLAAAYVRRMANKIAGNETYTAEPPAGPLRWGMSLADEMRVANLLAATICKMQKAKGGELLADCPADVEREAVRLGPGVYFRLENTFVSGPSTMPGGVNVDVVPALKNLCAYCRALAKSGGAVPPEREWATDAAALEIAISVLSELQEIREVRISAEPEADAAIKISEDQRWGKAIFACLEKIAELTKEPNFTEEMANEVRILSDVARRLEAVE